MEAIEDLKKSFLFSGLSKEDIQIILPAISFKSYKKKTLIFSEGEESHGFYILLSGLVKIYKLSSDGFEQILHIIHPYDTFGEAAIFMGSRYPATAETLLDSYCAFVDGEKFVKVLTERPRIALNFIVTLSLMLKELVNVIDLVSLKKVYARLAAYLLETAVILGKQKGEFIEFELPISKSELAKLFGTAKETLSRSFRKLQDLDCLKIERQKIIIKDLKKLQKAAEEERYKPKISEF